MSEHEWIFEDTLRAVQAVSDELDAKERAKKYAWIDKSRKVIELEVGESYYEAIVEYAEADVDGNILNWRYAIVGYGYGLPYVRVEWMSPTRLMFIDRD